MLQVRGIARNKNSMQERKDTGLVELGVVSGPDTRCGRVKWKKGH
jgi:hypothetical protein